VDELLDKIHLMDPAFASLVHKGCVDEVQVYLTDENAAIMSDLLLGLCFMHRAALHILHRDGFINCTKGKKVRTCANNHLDKILGSQDTLERFGETLNDDENKTLSRKGYEEALGIVAPMREKAIRQATTNFFTEVELRHINQSTDFMDPREWEFDYVPIFPGMWDCGPDLRKNNPVASLQNRYKQLLQPGGLQSDNNAHMQMLRGQEKYVSATLYRTKVPPKEPWDLDWDYISFFQNEDEDVDEFQYVLQVHKPVPSGNRGPRTSRFPNFLLPSSLASCWGILPFDDDVLHRRYLETKKRTYGMDNSYDVCQQIRRYPTKYPIV
jgi:hypothetical protein